METKEAIDKLRTELSKDDSYYYSWQSNIAMAFLDELVKWGYRLPDQHEIANQAAKNFLDMLIGTREKE